MIIKAECLNSKCDWKVENDENQSGEIDLCPKCGNLINLTIRYGILALRHEGLKNKFTITDLNSKDSITIDYSDESTVIGFMSRRSRNEWFNPERYKEWARLKNRI